MVGLEPIAELFDFIAREVLAVEIVSGPGEGEGTLLDLDDELLTEPVRVWIDSEDRRPGSRGSTRLSSGADRPGAATR